MTIPGIEKRIWEQRIRNTGGLASKVGAATGTISVISIVALINLAWDNGQQIGYVQALVGQNAKEIEQSRQDVEQWLSSQKQDMEEWTRSILERERQRWINGGPVYSSEIYDTWRAIASIPTDDMDGWTHDGKPRVQAIQMRMNGRKISKETRDMAWSLMKLSKTLRQ